MLSNRERDVLRLVSGHNKQIAYDLASAHARSRSTARTHAKMQAASLSDLVRMALITGILVRRPKASYD